MVGRRRTAVIQEVDDAIRSLIERDAINGSGAELVFDAPTKDWAARRNAPTIDAYLYDIREDLDRRRAGKLELRDDAGHVTSRRSPNRYFKLSYLLTAWTQRPEDEHRLLSALLDCFVRYSRLPPEFLRGAMGDIGEPVLITIGRPPPEDRPFPDVWTALGGELKPSLDLVVTAPIVSGTVREAAPLVREPPRLGLSRLAPPPGADGERSAASRQTRRGKRPVDEPAPAPPAAAAEPVEEGLAGRADDPAAVEDVGPGIADTGRVFRVRSFPRP
jgi:hypothetical protein